MEIRCSKSWFQKNLKKIMGVMNLNGREFGDLIGVTRQVVGYWARERHEMPVYIFMAYKYAFEKLELDANTEILLLTSFDLEKTQEEA